MLSRLSTSFLKINPPGLVLGGFFCYYEYMTPEQMIAQSIKDILEAASADGYSLDIDPYLNLYQEDEGDLRVETYSVENLPDKTYRVTVIVEEIA